MYRLFSTLNTPAYLLKPTTTNIKGVTKKTYPEPTKDDLIFISFKSSDSNTFSNPANGGSESISNGIISLVNQAIIETWYRPDITANCRIQLASDGTIWEIIGNPSNIEQKNRVLRFKVRNVSGGA